MTEQSISKEIGTPITINYRKPEAIGSSGFFLKQFIAKNKNDKTLKLNSKCNFEKRTGGLLLRTNYANKLAAIPIKNEAIISITLMRGKEKINPLFLSPLWVLLKLGVSIRYARHFSFKYYEYSINQMELNIITANYEMCFIANGYVFERQLNFFKSLDNSSHKLKVIL